MDMYQKRKIRAEKKNNNQEEKLTKVGINWYPGHMAKTKREIKEKRMRLQLNGSTITSLTHKHFNLPFYENFVRRINTYVSGLSPRTLWPT